MRDLDDVERENELRDHGYTDAAAVPVPDAGDDTLRGADRAHAGQRRILPMRLGIECREPRSVTRTARHRRGPGTEAAT